MKNKDKNINKNFNNNFHKNGQKIHHKRINNYLKYQSFHRMKFKVYVIYIYLKTIHYRLNYNLNKKYK